MTIILYYEFSSYKTFKDYYEKHVLINMKTDFNKLVSYTRFLELKNKAIIPLFLISRIHTLKECTGISFIDSFSMAACNIRRELSNKVFRGWAKKGKTSMGWFYGLKLHTVINHRGEIIDFKITSGNISDNNKNVLLDLTKNVSGKLFGDKGYIVNSNLFKKLYRSGITLVTKVRKNMKNRFINAKDKFMLKKSFRIC